MRIAGFTRGAIAVAASAGPALAGTVYEYKVDQVLSIGELGGLANHVFAVDIAGALGFKSGSVLTIDGIGWDLDLESNGPSKPEDMRLYVDDMAAPDGMGIFLRPGAGITRAGLCHTESPMIDLTTIGLLDVPLPTGVARLEFHETHDDPDVKVDGIWVSGTISFSIAQSLPSQPVPLPSAAGGGGVGLLILALFSGRRRIPRWPGRSPEPRSGRCV